MTTPDGTVTLDVKTGNALGVLESMPANSV